MQFSGHYSYFRIDFQMLQAVNEHYENTPVQYTAIFHSRKNDINFQMKNCDIFLIFAEAVLTSTHNLCFRAKI